VKLENQITGLEISKKLEEAEFPQDNSLWYWCKYKLVRGIYAKGFDEPKKGWRLQFGNKEGYRDDFSEVVAAPTVAELGEMLPYWVTCRKDISGKWFSSLHKAPFHSTSKYNTEADARAKMWLYLKKEGLLGEQKNGAEK